MIDEDENGEERGVPPKRHALQPFSLLGQADEISAQAARATPLLGDFILTGQATMIYAEPNAGKTLILNWLCSEAIEAGRIRAADLYYVNADDSSEGLSIKVRLSQDAGSHMLAPGYNGFRTTDLSPLLTDSADAGTARGTLVAIDTLKKFTDLMDKRRASEFAQACRRYVMAGGTIVALGHTAKNPNADGTPRYQGTTDILDDFDAVYMAQPVKPKNGSAMRGIRFTRKKSRGPSPETVTYAYANDADITYEERLASVRLVHEDDGDDFTVERENVSDPIVIEAFLNLIGAGSLRGQMALAKAAAKITGVSHRTALEILGRYTGSERSHLWNFEKGPRGVRIYRLIDRPVREP